MELPAKAKCSDAGRRGVLSRRDFTQRNCPITKMAMNVLQELLRYWDPEAWWLQHRCSNDKI